MVDVERSRFSEQTPITFEHNLHYVLAQGYNGRQRLWCAMSAEAAPAVSAVPLTVLRPTAVRLAPPAAPAASAVPGTALRLTAAVPAPIDSLVQGGIADPILG